MRKNVLKSSFLTINLFFLILSLHAQTWAPKTSGQSGGLYDVSFTSENNGWIVGNGGVITNTTDGGTTWSAQTSGTTQALRGVQFLNDNEGWIVGQEGTILHTNNGGSNWITQTSPTTSVLYSVHLTSVNKGCAVGGFTSTTALGTIITTDDGGSTWIDRSPSGKPVFYSVYFSSANKGWAVGASGIIMNTTDGGINWTTQNSGVTLLLRGVHFIDDNNGWVVGNTGTILHTTDGGVTWTAQTSGVTSTLNAVHFVNANKGWLFCNDGLNGVILTTTNGGQTWSAQSFPSMTWLTNGYFLNENLGFAVGNWGTLYKYTAPLCAPTSSTETISACTSYTWHGTTYTASNNTATWTGTNAAGCDSTVTLNLTIKQPSTSSATASACVSFSWNGNNYTSSGTYTWTGINAVGCDSVVTLNLTIKQTTSSAINQTAIESYYWHGQTYTTSGIYTWTGTNAAGCDSIVTLNLTINPINNISNVCPYMGTNQTLTYTASVSGASSYTWNLPSNTQLVSGQGTRSVEIKILNGFVNVNNKQLKVTPAGGSTQIIYLLAQAPVTPAVITASSGNISNVIGTNTAITYTIPKAYAAVSYIWSAQNGTTNITSINGSGVNDTSVAVTFTSGFTTSAITVQSVNDCGVSQARSLTITRDNPSVPGLISGPANVCEYIGEGAQTATYSVAAVSNVNSYTWMIPSGATSVSGQGTNAISFKYPSSFTSGSISVVATNGCGTSGSRSFSVNKLSAAMPSAIDVINIGACPSRTYSYTLVSMPLNATSVQWTIPAGGTIVSGQGTTSITVSYTGGIINGEVKARSINNCSVSSYRSVSVKLTACPAPGFATNKNTGALTSDNFGVTVYPNPTHTSFNLRVIGADSKELKVRVMDVQGRMIKSLIVLPHTTMNIGNDLKAGVYMLETRQGEEVKMVRVVKL